MDPASPTLDHADLPAALADLVAEATLEPIRVGKSGSVVARIVRPDGDVLVLKLVECAGAAPALDPEADRLRWLAERFPAPTVVAHGRDDLAEWLVTTSLAGHDATATPLGADPGRLATLLGEHLRGLHELDITTCPFQSSTGSLVQHARRQVDAGRVDPTDFQPIHRGLSPEELLELVAASVPDEPTDPVVTHGDYCLPNVVLHEDGTLSGLVDVGLLGVGDRYRDLGIGARSVARNLGGTAVGAFIDSYGLERPDLARLDAFVMIDELF